MLPQKLWQIRGNDVFHRELTARELARLILHIAKKRVYKSNLPVVLCHVAKMIVEHLQQIK